MKIEHLLKPNRLSICTCMHTSLCLFSMHVSASKYELTFLSFFPQKVLAANGAAKVSAYVTHGVFPNQSWLRFTHKDG